MDWISLIQKIFVRFGFEIHKKADIQIRNIISNKYLHGEGIEIGALHCPLVLPKSAKIKYVDKIPVEELKKRYPEVGNNIVKIDIIDDGEKLSKFKDSSLDFIIANHFLEHCKNPIGTIQNFLRVLKQGGILYMAIPDKRYTFDKNRQVTTIDHLIEVYNDGEDKLKRQHFEEWVRVVEGITDEQKFIDRLNDLINNDYSIHYHVWTLKEILELLTVLTKELQFKFDIELFMRNRIEIISVLKKID